MSWREIWVYFFVSVAIGLVIVAIFVPWHPPVGVYIAILAFLSVAVPLIRQRDGHEISVKERAFWSCVMALLVLLEIFSIYKEEHQRDVDQANAQAQQLEGFREIGRGIESAITQSQDHFSTTMTDMGKILTQEDATLTQTVGGASYPYFIATFPIDPTSNEMSVLVVTPGKPWPHGHIPTPEETAPLPDVAVDITEHPFSVDKMTTSDVESLMHPTHYNLGTLIVPGIFTAPFKLQKGKRYTLQITTRRGSFREDIYIDQDTTAPGGWRESWCIYGRRTVYKHGTVTSEEQLLNGKCN